MAFPPPIKQGLGLAFSVAFGERGELPSLFVSDGSPTHPPTIKLRITSQSRLILARILVPLSANRADGSPQSRPTVVMQGPRRRKPVLLRSFYLGPKSVLAPLDVQTVEDKPQLLWRALHRGIVQQRQLARCSQAGQAIAQRIACGLVGAAGRARGRIFFRPRGACGSDQRNCEGLPRIQIRGMRESRSGGGKSRATKAGEQQEGRLRLAP